MRVFGDPRRTERIVVVMQDIIKKLLDAGLGVEPKSLGNEPSMLPLQHPAR